MIESIGVFIPTVPSRLGLRVELCERVQRAFKHVLIREQSPDEDYRQQLCRGYEHCADKFPVEYVLRIDDDSVLAHDFEQKVVDVCNSNNHEPIITFYSNLKEDIDMVKRGHRYKRCAAAKIHGMHAIAVKRHFCYSLADYFKTDTKWDNKSGRSMGRAVKAGVFGVTSILVYVPSLVQQRNVKSCLAHGSSSQKQSRSFKLVYGDIE